MEINFRSRYRCIIKGDNEVNSYIKDPGGSKIISDPGGTGGGPLSYGPGGGMGMYDPGVGSGYMKDPGTGI